MSTPRNLAQKTATDDQYRALAEFRYHIRLYLHFSDEAAKAAGLEPKQYQLLLALRGLPEEVIPTVSALSEQLRIRHHSTVELVNRAERNGLVKRSRDGNYVLLHLTGKGQKVLARAVDQRLQDLRVAGPVLVKALQKLLKGEASDSQPESRRKREA